LITKKQEEEANQKHAKELAEVKRKHESLAKANALDARHQHVMNEHAKAGNVLKHHEKTVHHLKTKMNDLEQQAKQAK
jgi:hypothetical protein